MNQPSLKWDHWHIEASSICTLKCPRCPRAESPEDLINKQLSLRFFKDRIGSTIISQIKKITFCGNDGDPIYNKEFIDIVRFVKEANPNITIVTITNGSYKTTDWWKELGQVLDHNDEIHWSIDGLNGEMNSMYRVNSDWNSIISGIDAFMSTNTKTYKVWDTIGFKFNENHIEDIKAFAMSKGFDSFQFTASTKFGSFHPISYGENDPLEPSKEYVSCSLRYKRSFTTFNDLASPSKKMIPIFVQRATELKESNHSGICLIGNKGVFLNSRGEFYPCCWVANRYDHNKDWQNRGQTQFNLHTRTFSEILNDPFWSNEFLNFNSFECTTKCNQNRLQDDSHTTEW